VALGPQRDLLVFSVGGLVAALPLENVERIAPMARLARPPGLPAPLEGILDLGGTAVPVLRLDRLLGLPIHEAGLYSMLIILKGLAHGGVALLVERTSEIRSVSFGDVLPLDQEDSFNECAEASFIWRGQSVPILSPQRILLERETQVLSEFQRIAQQRIKEWGAGDR
jgi:purine-binding chemotaxis protein CheW